MGLRSGPKHGKSFFPDTLQPLIYADCAANREQNRWPHVVISRPTV